MKSIQLRLSLIPMFIALSYSAFAQTPNLNSLFINEQKEAFNNWSEKLGINGIIKLQLIQTYNDTIQQLRFTITGTKAWNNLADSLRHHNLPDPGNLIGLKASFLLDENPEHIQLFFKSSDAIIVCSSENGNFKSLINFTQGNYSSNSDKILEEPLNVNYVNNIRVISSVAYKADQYKEGIKSILKSLCANKSTFLRKYDIVYTSTGNNLHATITNISKVVLDESYFEMIDLRFKIDPDVKKIECAVNCKYAAGAIWKPYESSYTDMQKDFPQRVQHFAESFESLLYNKFNQ